MENPITIRIIFYGILMKLYFFLALFFFPPLSHGKTFSTKEAYMFDDTFSNPISIFVDSKLNGESEANAIIVYYPINISDGNISLRLSSTEYSNLPFITSGLPYNTEVQLTMKQDLGTNMSYYVAVKKDNDTNFEIISIVEALPSNQAEQNVKIKFFDLCRIGKCRLDIQGSDPVDDNQIIYIVAATTNLNLLNKPIDFNLEAFKNGVFFNLRLSSLFDTKNAPELLNVARGDSELSLLYNTDNVNKIITADLEKVVIIHFPDTLENLSAMIYKNAFSFYNAEKVELDPPTEGNYVKYLNLENDRAYNVGITFRNKFGYYSLISPSQTQTPISIETFLKEKGCFLLSAGFQTDDPILDYFRSIRDQYLLKHKIGKYFVFWYYSWAENWAPMIYQHPFLASMVRALAKVFYFSIIHFQGILQFLLFLTLLGTILFFSVRLYTKSKTKLESLNGPYES
jgi:hypothetical protein